MNKTIEFFIEKYLESVKSHFHPQEMWLWGSYVYGKPREDSDLDVLLISKDFEKHRFIRRSTEVIKQLKTWADRDIPDIDFLCYTPDEFAKKKNQISLVNEITQKGLKVI